MPQRFPRVLANAAAAAVVLVALLIGGCFPEPTPPSPEPTVLEVRLLETDPASPARVATSSRLSVRIGYRSDQPITFSAHPFRDGSVVPAGFNGSPAWPAGDGEALAWFFLSEPGAVDAVRIEVGRPDGRGTFRSFDFPLDAVFVRDAGAARSEAAWVARLDAAVETLRTAQAPAPDDGVGWTIAALFLVNGVLAVLILGAALPIAGIRRWDGRSRVGAWIALGLYALPILNVIVGVLIDPTSHNLWPLELFVWALASILLCVGIFLVRRLAGGSRR